MFDSEWAAKTDSRLRIAKWDLEEIPRRPPAASVETIEFAKRAADHADVVTVFSAATAEARLNTFIMSPLLFMEEKGSRRFVAELLTKYLRLDMPRKLKFLRSRVPT